MESVRIHLHLYFSSHLTQFTAENAMMEAIIVFLLIGYFIENLPLADKMQLPPQSAAELHIY